MPPPRGPRVDARARASHFVSAWPGAPSSPFHCRCSPPAWPYLNATMRANISFFAAARAAPAAAPSASGAPEPATLTWPAKRASPGSTPYSHCVCVSSRRFSALRLRCSSAVMTLGSLTAARAARTASFADARCVESQYSPEEERRERGYGA